MSFWDSFSGAVDTVSSKAEDILNTGVKLYTAKTNFDTAKANQDTARTVAKLNAQAQVLEAKKALNPTYATESQPSILDGPQSTPIVINKQTDPGGIGTGTLIMLALIGWGLSHA